MKKTFAFLSKTDSQNFQDYMKDLGLDVVSKYIHLKGFVSFVDEKDYNYTLINGLNYLLNKTDLEGKVEWFDCLDNVISIDYIPFVCLKLAKTRKVDNDWCVFNYPIDINFFNNAIKMKYKFNMSDLKIFVNEKDNLLLYYIKSDFYTNEEIINMRDEFLQNYKRYLGVDKILPYDVGTKIIMEDEEEKTCNLNSYFKNSLFIKSLYEPKGVNIVPKVKIPSTKYITGYKTSDHSISLEKFNVTKINGPKQNIGTYKIFGNFLLKEMKKFNKFYDDFFGHCIDIAEETFIMLDNGNFKVKLNDCVFDDRECGVEMTTNIDLYRNVLGYDYHDKCIRDGIFNNVPHENTNQSIEIKEYFRKIGNGKKLLHYSNVSNAFEIFILPTNWSIDNGLDNLLPSSIFASINELSENYCDFEIIKEIMESRNKTKMHTKKKI